MSYALLLLFSFAVHAGETETRIQVNPSVYPPSAFQGKVDEASSFSKKRSPESVPDRPTRESIFEKVNGLGEHVKHLDELDRDLLLLRAKNQSLAQLKASYPTVPEKLLTRLRTEARKHKW